MKHPKNAFLLAGILVSALASSGCMGPKGDTAGEKVAFAQEKRDEILQAFYERDPDLEKEVAASAGYIVFNNFSVHPGLFSFATGYGVLTNNATKKDTHQKWFRLTLGPGIAVKGLYILVLIDDQEKLERLAKGRWVLGSQAEASLRFGDFGGGLEWGAVYGQGARVHYFTHTGFALELELIGAGKVSPNSKLNEAVAP